MTPSASSSELPVPGCLPRAQVQWAWLLSRPVGFGMGRLPGLAEPFVWLTVGLAGVGFIALRVPTRR